MDNIKTYVEHFKSCLKKLRIRQMGTIKNTPYEEKYGLIEERKNEDILRKYIMYIKKQDRSLYEYLQEKKVLEMMDKYGSSSVEEKIIIYKTLLSKYKVDDV